MENFEEKDIELPEADEGGQDDKKEPEPLAEGKGKCPVCKTELGFMNWCPNCKMKM